METVTCPRCGVVAARAHATIGDCVTALKARAAARREGEPRILAELGRLADEWEGRAQESPAKTVRDLIAQFADARQP